MDDIELINSETKVEINLFLKYSALAEKRLPSWKNLCLSGSFLGIVHGNL